MSSYICEPLRAISTAENLLLSATSSLQGTLTRGCLKTGAVVSEIVSCTHYYLFSLVRASQQKSNTILTMAIAGCTVFPRKDTQASISYRGLFVVKIQHKNKKIGQTGILTRVLKVLRSSRLPNAPVSFEHSMTLVGIKQYSTAKMQRTASV